MKFATVTKSAVMGLALLFASSAFAASKANLTLNHPTTVNGTQLKAGDYKLEWEGSGPDVQLSIVKGKNVVAKVPAKVVELNNKASNDAAVLKDNGNGTTYCQNLFVNPNGIQRVFRDMAMFALGPSPAPAMANNLFTFLAMRGNQSFTGLNCTNLLNMANPIQLTMNGNGVVVAATFMPAAAKPMPRQR